MLEWPGYDRLWLDEERGLCLVRREVTDRSTGALMQRIELSEHEEVAPDLWLPRRIRNVQLDSGAPNVEARNRVVLDAKFDILECRVNDSVRDKDFQLCLLPGTLKLRGDEPPEQVRPGGYDHLEHLAAWIQKYRRPDRKHPLLADAWQGICTGVSLVVLYRYYWRQSARRHGCIPQVPSMMSEQR